ncbi:hypothetical protein GCM10009092_42830 [Bowmanella denitrificans]|uniref:MSHA biogenesis protein MshF n=1 Tax=Bowmanella denitrificans TaxID=366582 RepID=A0ABP3HM03_9ALTE|nr:hypothetical protein [Bowmanella denitrificans]
MSDQSVSDNNLQRLMIQIIIVVAFALLMVFFIWYLNDSEDDIKKVSLEMLADEMAEAVVSARWQWEAEGRPARILQIRYNSQGKEVDRRPIAMSHIGWPRVEPNSEGCAALWQSVLNVPLEVESFKVYPEYFDGVAISGKALDSTCRFRLSTGPFFEYRIYTGQVIKQQ